MDKPLEIEGIILNNEMFDINFKLSDATNSIDYKNVGDIEAGIVVLNMIVIHVVDGDTFRGVLVTNEEVEDIINEDGKPKTMICDN